MDSMTTAPPTADELVLMKHLAENLGMSYSTMRSWYTDGVAGHRLQGHYVGGRLYCRPSWVLVPAGRQQPITGNHQITCLKAGVPPNAGRGPNEDSSAPIPFQPIRADGGPRHSR